MNIVLKPISMAAIIAMIVILAALAIVNHKRLANTGVSSTVVEGSSLSGQTDGAAASTRLTVFDDAPGKDWDAPGLSWAKDVNYACTDEKFSGKSSIRMHFKQYEGVKLLHHGSIPTGRYDRLAFHVRGGANGLSGLCVKIAEDGKLVGKFCIALAPSPPQTWQTVSIPMSMFAFPANSSLNEIWVQSYATTDQHFYVDDIELLPKGASEPTGVLIAMTQQAN